MDCVKDIWVELLKSEPMTGEFIGESFTVLANNRVYLQPMGRPRNLGGYGYGGWGWGWGCWNRAWLYCFISCTFSILLVVHLNDPIENRRKFFSSVYFSF